MRRFSKAQESTKTAAYMRQRCILFDVYIKKL